MKRPRLSLLIDKLQLEGIPAELEPRLAPVIERHLERLLASSRFEQSGAAWQSLPRSLPAAKVVLSPQEGAEAAGQKIATAIYQALGTGRRA